MVSKDEALARVVELQAATQEAEQAVVATRAARDAAIAAAVNLGVTKYRISKTLGVTATTVANAVTSTRR